MAENIKREIIVIDASVVLSSLLDDEVWNKEFEMNLKMAAKRLVVLKAPFLLKLEVANALFWAVSKKRTTWDVAKEQLKFFLKYPISYDELDNFIRIFELTKKYELTVYDASYLYEAEKYKSRLFSLDKKLVKAYNSLIKL
jgi:predicted nucleic acid-binding protein